MGVPALFRWLSRKYPKIISPVVEGDVTQEIGAAQYSDPNPNGELDNLYLDMNGIVHPCSHPEHKLPPETEDEMFLDVFKYTDRVLLMARPRKVLMIAVDGVAPRAKMNQQRSRRFRSAQDAKIAHEEKERQIRERESRGELIDDAIKGKKSWDSNAITPGTPFMDSLAQALRYWVAYKLATDPGWANLQVIISDATVPGEGEHKLMSFIRLQRLDPEYDPNTKHCIYGLDADLIFLGLATHEPHFRVLREDVFANQSRQMRISDQLLMTQEQKDSIAEQDAKKPFLWLHVNVLREYLEIELYNPHLSFPFDLERAIDDWVFMCFFVGNDFLPHLPSLDVRDNGIDILVNCWKRMLPKLRDYITCDGNLNLDSVEKLLSSLSYKEDEIFRKRHEGEKRREENDKRRKLAQEEEKALKNQYIPQVSKGSDKAPLTADINMPLLSTSGDAVEGYAQLSNKDIVENRDVITKANMSNADAAAALKKLLDSKNNKETDKNVSASAAIEEQQNKLDINTAENSKKRPIEQVEAELPKPDENGDSVRMWEPGYRQRYYQSKFGVISEEEINKIRRDMVRCYLEGISWVLLYYYQGCPSWQWYYPYHYAPFAADFVNVNDIIGEQGIKFTLGEPFKPYEQLMSVLPAASGHNLPEVLRILMSDPSSEILDFYPEEFQIDMNGKKMSWQGIALLPFIDENRLLEALEKRYHLLTDDERERNTLKNEVLFISNQNKNYKRFYNQLYDNNVKELQFRFSRSSLAGTVIKNEYFVPDGITKFPLREGDMPDLNNNEFFQSSYKMPAKKMGKSMLINGYISHTRTLTQEDRDSILHGNQRNGGYNRFRTPNDNSGYVNKGPSGKEDYLIYSMRRGGYRAFMHNLKNQTQQNHQPVPMNAMANNSYDNQYNSYSNNNNYNNNYNGGYNNYRNNANVHYPNQTNSNYSNQNSYNNYNNQNSYNNYNNRNNHGNYNNYNRYNNQGSNYDRQSQGSASSYRSGYIPAPNRTGNFRNKNGYNR